MVGLEVLLVVLKIQKLSNLKLYKGDNGVKRTYCIIKVVNVISI